MSAEWKISGRYILLLALDLNSSYLIQNTSCANQTNRFFSLCTYLTENTACPNYANCFFSLRIYLTENMACPNYTNCFFSLLTYLTENTACPNYEDQHWQEVINLCQVFL
jgi:hypothetical protein